jgi:hypothetical protein
VWLTKYSAIIIGCSPAFAVFIRKRLNGSKKASSHAHGYLKQLTNGDIELKNMVDARVRSERNDMDAYWDDIHGSREELAKNAGHVVASPPEQQDHEQSSGKCKTQYAIAHSTSRFWRG